MEIQILKIQILLEISYHRFLLLEITVPTVCVDGCRRVCVLGGGGGVCCCFSWCVCVCVCVRARARACMHAIVRACMRVCV